MGYRDDQGDLRARIAQLEHELSTAHDTIERLKGGHVDDLPLHDGAPASGVTPAAYRYAQMAPALDDDGREKVLAMLQERLPGGTADRAGDDLVYRVANQTIAVRQVEAGTSVVASALFSGQGFGQFFIGTFATVILGGGLVSAASAAGLSAAWTVAAIALAAIAGLTIARGVLGWEFRRTRKRLAGTVETIERIAEDAASTRTGVRIASDEEAAIEEAALAEAAEAEATREKA